MEMREKSRDKYSAWDINDTSCATAITHPKWSNSRVMFCIHVHVAIARYLVQLVVCHMHSYSTISSDRGFTPGLKVGHTC